jgi:transcriptional regulator with XRE-family HTH domain
MARVLSRRASTAVKILGSEIAQARRERRWPQGELAVRAGVSPVTVRAVEHGSPSVAIGTVLELAVLTGVPLFSQDATDLPRQLANSRDRLSLLPKRVRVPARPVNDDF